MNIQWPILIAAFSSGVIGSLHCVGMCGPLVASMPFVSHKKGQLLKGMMQYHAGRLFMYIIIGAVVGALGKSFHFFGMQQILSIVAGVFVLIILFADKIFPASIRQKFHIIKPYSWMSQLLKKNTNHFSAFTAGLLNGLLPCGLVYVAAGAAFATGSLLQGSSAMLLFGIGTIPLLTIAVLMSKLITISLRERFRKLMPILVVSIAFLLILRGLGLNIPYLSPAMEGTSTAVSCHSK